MVIFIKLIFLYNKFNIVLPGDYLRSSNFPNLKQVIQISHKTIPGTQKFKVFLNSYSSYNLHINI
jgi:hypothetical protein